MTRRSFFSLLAAPVVAPMVPKEKSTTRKYIRIDITPWPIAPNSDTARCLIDAINKEVKRGAITLTATEVKR